MDLSEKETVLLGNRFGKFLIDYLGVLDVQTAAEQIQKAKEVRPEEVDKMRADQGIARFNAVSKKRWRTMSDRSCVRLYDPVTKYWPMVGMLIPHQITNLLTVVRFIREPKTIVDVGCGPCASLVFLKSQGLIEADIIGTDASAGMVELASNLARSVKVEARFQQAWAHKLPLQDESVDAVISFNMLHWTERWAEALQEMARVCSRPGRILIEYCPDEMRKQIPPDKVRKVLNESGIIIEGISVPKGLNCRDIIGFKE